MADEHIPSTSPHSPAPITTTPSVNPSPHSNGQRPDPSPSAPANNNSGPVTFMLGIISFAGRLFRSTKFHPEAEARTETRKRPQQAQHGDSVREVIETIVFVVVLVLLLKSFAAEAFVIPTGSMAETLLGYQKEVTCPDCGLKFPINCSQEVDPSEGARPTPVFACVCPNCRQHIHFSNAPREFTNNTKDSVPVPDPGWNSGDRVLVAKFVYDLFKKDPDRLDVVVFKYPGGNDFPQSGPHRGHVPMNYIKRLVLLPGETGAICGGDLYFLSADKGPRYDDYEKAKLDPDLMATLWKKEHMHIDQAANLFRERQFQIIRKGPENILAMMRLVFDNDHRSQSDPASTDRWRSNDGNWTETEPHGFRHDGNGQIDWLRYQHFVREFPGRRSLITDMMGYNTYQSGFGGGINHAALPGDNWVGDLILECEATIDNPQGELTLELSRGIDRFQAQWDLSTGTCTLLRITKNGEQKLETKATAMKKKGTYRLRFADVDQRLVVWVDGDLPFENGVTYAPPDDLGPREENDLERPASIGVRDASLAIQKLKLFRDTYYTTGGVKQGGGPAEKDVHDFDPLDPGGGHWAELRDPPFVTLYVQPDHYLCMGDNSPESSDGRSWGAVPRRLLLGRALLVYYPFGRAGRIR